jgi:hypothetical protein
VGVGAIHAVVITGMAELRLMASAPIHDVVESTRRVCTDLESGAAIVKFIDGHCDAVGFL